MSLPKELSPDPLVISAVEIRFISDLNDENLLSTFFPILATDLPQLATSKIPQGIRKIDAQFKYSPDYSMSNGTYMISFSNKVLLVENIGKYTLWPNYFGFIKTQLSKIFLLNSIKSIERIGVRYASMLNQEENLNYVIKHNPVFSIQGFDEEILQIRTNFKKNNNNLHLQIAQNAKSERQNQVKIGLLLDIDASRSEPHIEVIPEQIFTIIDELHTAEKTLFFELLNPTYLNKLNPKY